MKGIMQKGSRYCTDILVIGGGIAGLSFILELAQHKPNCEITLITKNKLIESNSAYAQGGFAATRDNQKETQSHMADTLRAGDGLCYTEAVKEIVFSGAASLEFLLNKGVNFDRNAAGELELAQEGGHATRRIYHHHDQTGYEIIRALSEAVSRLPNVKIQEFHTAINLITRESFHQPGKMPEVEGVYVLDEKSGLIHTFFAKALVLATGGAGKVYRYTSNPDVATGDGIAMAFRAGARVSNMEFYQFHPTLLYHPGKMNFLITEALRGEGAYLRRVDSGERFMVDYAPAEMELATRDIIARAIFTEIEHSLYNFVYLDVRHLKPAYLRERFPGIDKTLHALGIDIAKSMVPVVPCAHYLCGGILTDVAGRTDLPRLFAIGETACTGLHGANRLASNSLLEGVVMARKSVAAVLPWLDKPLEEIHKISDWDSQSVTDLRRASQINAHWRSLRGEMTSYAGIIRTAEGLKDVLRLIRARLEMIEEYYWRHTVTRDLVELRNIVLVAELIARSALLRHESRGGHYRADYPEKLENVQETVLRMSDMSKP